MLRFPVLTESATAPPRRAAPQGPVVLPSPSESRLPDAPPAASPAVTPLDQRPSPPASLEPPQSPGPRVDAPRAHLGLPILLAPPAHLLGTPPACDFAPTPLPADTLPYEAEREIAVYDDKRAVPVQRPLIEWGIPWYDAGILPPSGTLLGPTNLTQPRFFLYGDYRTGIAAGHDGTGRIESWAHRLNLDLDYRLTATERFHGFLGPLNRGVQFSRIEFEDGNPRLREVFNPNFVTAFFEGDLGALIGGFHGTAPSFDLPFSVGLLPLLYQNGIWMEDAVVGGAVAVPTQHSQLLGWPNFDATVFAAIDRVDSAAFGTDDHAAQLFGTAWFIDAYDGYIEAGWAYVRDSDFERRSYHNATISFTRRYFHRFSNSVRVLSNFGQDLPRDARTADGLLVLVETSLISAQPDALLPYLNLFAGFDRPQSVARSAFSGGVLRNTGINFETDGLNGYPTLDASANNTLGGALGFSWLGLGFDRQLLFEAAYLHAHAPPSESVARGDQFALGSRLQWPLSHRTLIRVDGMYGWRSGEQDVMGTRAEWRWKF